MNVSVRLLGVREAQERFRLYREAAETLGRLRGVVGTNVVYAPYQEFGTRFMRGAHMFGRASERVAPQIPGLVARGLTKGPQGMREAFQSILLLLKAEAQAGTRVATSRLRNSYAVAVQG